MSEVSDLVRRITMQSVVNPFEQLVRRDLLQNTLMSDTLCVLAFSYSLGVFDVGISLRCYIH